MNEHKISVTAKPKLLNCSNTIVLVILVITLFIYLCFFALTGVGVSFCQCNQEDRTSGMKGVKETWWWNQKVQEFEQGKKKRLSKNKCDTERTEESRQEYKEMQ